MENKYDPLFASSIFKFSAFHDARKAKMRQRCAFEIPGVSEVSLWFSLSVLAPRPVPVNPSYFNIPSAPQLKLSPRCLHDHVGDCDNGPYFCSSLLFCRYTARARNPSLATKGPWIRSVSSCTPCLSDTTWAHKHCSGAGLSCCYACCCLPFCASGLGSSAL